MLMIMDLFLSEFSSFLDDSRICYYQESQSVFYLNGGMLCVKLVPPEEINKVHYTPSFSGRYIILHQDRWINRREIVKSIILGLSGKNRVIYARNTSIEKINKDVVLQHRISLIGDAHSFEYFYEIRWIEYMGIKWEVTLLEVARPRIIATLGGRYNG